MSFNPNIPQPGDIISQSQAQIQTNFAQSNTIFGNDHVQFDAGANQGKHNKSTYLDQALDPVTAANEIAVYSKDNAGASTLYIRQESNGAVIQMSGANPTVAAAGSTFLPGGLIIKYGTATIGGGLNTVAVSFAGLGIGNFPGNCFVAIATPLSASAGLVSSNYPGTNGLTTTGFNINRNGTGGALSYQFIAIGN